MKQKTMKLMGLVLLLVSMTAMLFGCQEKKVAYDEPAVPGITYENYDRIVVGDEKTGEGGMTSAEVFELMGKEPSNQMEMTIGGVKTVHNEWHAKALNEDGPVIGVTFADDHVSSKVEMGFESK